VEGRKANNPKGQRAEPQELPVFRLRVGIFLGSVVHGMRDAGPNLCRHSKTNND
jgi:hypothetical protein